jgi:hypothetical protein
MAQNEESSLYKYEALSIILVFPISTVSYAGLTGENEVIISIIWVRQQHQTDCRTEKCTGLIAHM